MRGMKINIKREILVILFIIITPMLHEIAHFLVYVIQGVPATIEYGYVRTEISLCSALLAGPLYHILVSSICLILERYNKKNKEIWALIGLATILSRLVSTCMVIGLRLYGYEHILYDNDEGYVAVSIGIPIGVMYAICFLLYFISSILHIKRIKEKGLVIRMVLYTILVLLYLTGKW